jgi:hypothetical protein
MDIENEKLEKIMRDFTEEVSSVILPVIDRYENEFNMPKSMCIHLIEKTVNSLRKRNIGASGRSREPSI